MLAYWMENCSILRLVKITTVSITATFFTKNLKTNRVDPIVTAATGMIVIRDTIRPSRGRAENGQLPKQPLLLE